MHYIEVVKVSVLVSEVFRGC